MSITDQRWTVHLTWSPGAYKLPTALRGSWRRDSPGWEKTEDKFTATSGLRVRVCVCVLTGSWRRDRLGYEKTEDKYTAPSGLRVRVCVCVCVCPVSPIYITRV